VEKDRRTGNVTFRYDHSPDKWWVPVFTFKLVCDEDGNCRIVDAFGFTMCDIEVVDGVLGIDCSYLGNEGTGVFRFNEDGQFCYYVTGGGEGCFSLDPQGHPLAPLVPYILPFGEDFWPGDWPNREGDETDICAPFEEYV
jgi:hypothetical protein